MQLSSVKKYASTALALILFLTGSVLAQQTNNDADEASMQTSSATIALQAGSLRGTIKDTLGGVIIGATITATSAGGAIKTATTNGEGVFKLIATPAVFFWSNSMIGDPTPHLLYL